MNVIRVLIEIQPEQRADFLTHMQQETADIPQQFDGCLRFDLYQSPFAENQFLLYEEWESQAQFSVYRESDYFKQNGQKLFSMINGKPNSAYFQAETIS